MSVVEVKHQSLDGNTGRLTHIAINRPDAANAFSAEVIKELHDAFLQAQEDSTSRAVLLTGRGRHFCAGADLNWMKDSAKLGREGNIKEARSMAAMFTSFSEIAVPTIVACQGAVYGGGVGLVACADIVIARDNVKFCISEAKLGIIPAVIMPFLNHKIKFGSLRELMLTARVFQAEEAQRIGLVQRIVTESEQNEKLLCLLNEILTCSPQAQRAAKKLHDDVFDGSQVDTAEAIADIRASDEGQRGLDSFFSKDKAPWVAKVSGDVWS